MTPTRIRRLGSKRPRPFRIASSHSENATYVHLSWQIVEGKTVATIRVDKSKRPVYLNLQGKSEFYIRTGNTSQPLDVREATAYIRDHWPDTR